ncbi:MAG: hypothetical protein ACKOZT_09635 [Cyanobium sp.]
MLAGLLTACAEEPLPKQRLSRDDCLIAVKLDRLKEALARCDKVVAAFPQDPLPLNERFLLHTLAEDEKAACRDITLAVALTRRLPPARLDPLLREDLQRRQAACPAAPQATAGLPASGASADKGSKAAPTSPTLQELPDQHR